jgi:hypothetical protein
MLNTTESASMVRPTLRTQAVGAGSQVQLVGGCSEQFFPEIIHVHGTVTLLLLFFGAKRRMNDSNSVFFTGSLIYEASEPSAFFLSHGAMMKAAGQTPNRLSQAADSVEC